MFWEGCYNPRVREYFEEMKGRVLDLINRGHSREDAEEQVNMFSCFPVERGKEVRTESFIRLGVGRMYSQLVESSEG
jgi:hypothetical protein